MSELKLPYLNLVMIAGRLVDEPHELKAKDDVTGASFVVAANKWLKGKPQLTTYVDVICWNDTAKSVLEKCGKGAPVIVFGALQNHTKKVGKSEVKKLQVSAQQVQFLAKQTDSEAPGPA